MTVVIPKKLKGIEKKVYSDLTAKKRKSGKKRQKKPTSTLIIIINQAANFFGSKPLERIKDL